MAERSSQRLLVAMAAFGLVAIVAGIAAWRLPHVARGAASLTATVKLSPSSAPSPSCSAPTPGGQPLPTPRTAAISLPADAWVNAAVGANLRAAPGTSARFITTLARATAGRADQVKADSSGAQWYRLTSGDLIGWIRGDLLDFKPITLISGYDYQSPGWSLIVPADHSLGVAPGRDVEMQVGREGQPYWFLMVHSVADASALPPPVPFIIGGVDTDLYDTTQSVTVWNYQVNRRTVRAWFDVCKYPHLSQTAGGWPYLSAIQVITPNRAYQFLFVTEQPDTELTNKIIDSVRVA